MRELAAGISSFKKIPEKPKGKNLPKTSLFFFFFLGFILVVVAFFEINQLSHNIPIPH